MSRMRTARGRGVGHGVECWPLNFSIHLEYGQIFNDKENQRKSSFKKAREDRMLQANHCWLMYPASTHCE